jgi:hypothetical protein
MLKMTGNRFVRILPADGGLLVDKTKGELFVRDIMEALESNSDDNVYAMFIRACRFDGWAGDDRAVKQVRLYDIESSDACPLCSKAWQKMRDDFYEEGYRAGQNEAQK